MTRREGLVVALSGMDSAGKSTQRDLLVEALRRQGREPLCVWTRAGYTRRVERLKKLGQLLSGKKKKAREQGEVSAKPGRYPRRASTIASPLKRRLWLTTAILDLLWVYAVQLRYWRARGRTVVCDRYLLDCLVDFRVNFPDDRVEERLLGRFLRRLAVRPHAAFCLLVSADESLRRSRNKSRHHWETREVLDRRFEQYRAVGEELSVRMLDGELPGDQLASAIQAALPAS